MELALSPEGNTIKLFMREIKWKEVANAFNNETVKIDFFEHYIDNPFPLECRSLDDDYLSLTLPKITVPISKINEWMILKHPLKKVKNIDEDKLKEWFPKSEIQGLSAQEIWKKYLLHQIPYREPIDVRLGNEDIYIESSNIHTDYDLYCITFQKKEKLQDFLQKANLTISRRAAEELDIAVQEGKAYATEGLRAAFEEAGIIDRILNLEILKGRAWNDSPEQKLTKEFALSIENASLKLFAQGISWKDFLQVFEDEVVDVFELNVIGPDKFPSNDDYFEIVDDNLEEPMGSWIKFRRKQLSFRELFIRVSSLNVKEDLKEPFLSNIGNRNFEMKFTFADSCCCLKFWRKDKLLFFLERMVGIIPQPVMTELKSALNDGKAYCTEGLKQDFERASNLDRIERLITLIKHYWIPSEGEELKIALASTSKSILSQLGHEPTTKDSLQKGRYHPSGMGLVYTRLERDGMECFDGDGNIYGFNGEVVIRNIISVYEKWKKKLPDEVEFMNGLLNKYIDRFGKSLVGPAQY